MLKKGKRSYEIQERCPLPFVWMSGRVREGRSSIVYGVRIHEDYQQFYLTVLTPKTWFNDSLTANYNSQDGNEPIFAVKELKIDNPIAEGTGKSEHLAIQT